MSALQLYGDSSETGATAEKQSEVNKGGKQDVRCATYFPTSFTTGAGHSRKVSSIPAGLSSTWGKAKITLRKELFFFFFASDTYKFFFQSCQNHAQHTIFGI